MIVRTLAELAAQAGTAPPGEGADPALLVGPDIAIDSRAVTPGSLFVALPGEHVDGHAYVAAAGAAGAVAALVAHRVDAPDGPVQLVADPDTGGPVAALGRLASVSVAALPALQVVGITGSSGKTSVKDLLQQVLAATGPTVAPVGSFNNEIGLPLTALRADAATRFLVLEMGARGLGHIGYLCSLVQPQIAVVLNVGQAHLGEFGTPEVTARAKGELVEALGRGEAAQRRAAVLNADDPLVRGMAERSDAPVTWFARDSDPGGDMALWAEGVAADDLGRCGFDLLVRRGTASAQRHAVRLQLVGRHHVANALAAAATAVTLGLDGDQVASALTAAVARSHWRMEVSRLGSGIVMINDAYNANPESMLAALETVAWMAEHRSGGRIVAVFGDMLELGARAQSAHRELGEQVARHGVARLVVAGEYADDVIAGALDVGMSAAAMTRVADTAATLDLLPGLLEPGDLVLVKASRSIHFEHVAARLTELLPVAGAPR